MKCSLAPTVRGAPQRVFAARIATRTELRPTGAPPVTRLCVQATSTSPAPSTATSGLVTAWLPVETLTALPHRPSGNRFATRTPSRTKATAAVPSAATATS